MLTPEQIPDDVVLAWTRAWYSKDKSIKECLAAAINAWPDMRAESRAVCDVIVLPIREPRDE